MIGVVLNTTQHWQSKAIQGTDAHTLKALQIENKVINKQVWIRILER